MNLIWAVLIIGTIIFVLSKVKPKRTDSNGASRATAPGTVRKRVAAAPPPTDVAPHVWPGEGNFEFEVVGESNYQNHIRVLAGEHGDEWANTQHVALLVPEDQNPHDDKAVSVIINGGLVGYLSRDDARSFRRRLSAKKLGRQITGCAAVVRGGGIKNGQRVPYGVWLDMKPFNQY